jgi:PAS domain S-box-containing protein
MEKLSKQSFLEPLKPVLLGGACSVFLLVLVFWFHAVESGLQFRAREATNANTRADVLAAFVERVEKGSNDVRFLARLAEGSLDTPQQGDALKMALKAYAATHEGIRALRLIEPEVTSVIRREPIAPGSSAGAETFYLEFREAPRTAPKVAVLLQLDLSSWLERIEAEGWSLRPVHGGNRPDAAVEGNWNRPLPVPAGARISSAEASEEGAQWILTRPVDPVGRGEMLSWPLLIWIFGALAIGVAIAVFSRKSAISKAVGKATAHQAKADLERLAGMIDRIPVPVFYLDERSAISHVNAAFERFIGSARKDLLGKSLREFMPPEKAVDFLDWEDLQVLPEDGAGSQEATVVNAFDELRKVTIKVSAAGSGNDRVPMIGTLIDNTEGANALIAMEGSLDLMTKVTSQIPGMVFELKRRRDGSFVFPYASVGIQEILEVSPLEVESQAETAFARIHPDDRERFIAALEESAASMRSWKQEFRVTRGDGEVRWLLGNAMPEKESSHAVLWHGFVADVTDLKEIEKELTEAKAEAERANRAKSAFLAAMSHEIRTPMNGVIGMTSLLGHTEMTEEQAGYVHTIRHSGDALLVVINDILDFSKIESGNLELERLPFDPAECIEGVVDILSMQASKKGLAIAYYIDEAVPLEVKGDVTRIRQILVNMVGNAIKFTREGEVFVNVDVIEKDGHPYLRVTVEDTGAGIPENRRNRLFKPFSQVDSSTNRVFGGTGLGLAISKRLTSLMDGFLDFESVEGEGSSFFFLLPLEENRAVPHGSRYVDKAIGLEGRRVLVVDPRALHRAVISSYLNAWKMQSVEAKDFDETLALLQEGDPFDAIFIDQDLYPEDPDASARYEFEKRVEAFGAKVIAMDIVGKKARQGSHGLVFKPIKPQALCQSLRTFLLEETPGRNRENTVAVDARETEAEPFEPIQILLAEDNRVNQKVATMMLEKLGYEADIARNGEEAFHACRDHSYDVVLMDIQMPVMDGLEATRAIREMTDDLHQPWIVALTANATTADRDQAIENGMNDYLAKPVKLDDLNGVLSRFRQRRSELKEGEIASLGGEEETERATEATV